MTDVVIQARNLSHRYAKDWAIKDLNFELMHDGVIGLLGANGAGKSTFMNIVCGAIFQTRGDVLVNGVDIREDPITAKQHIGYLPQSAPLHLELSVQEYLRHCARLRKVPEADIPRAVSDAMEKCGITHFRNRLIRNLSGGYQQRVGIAQAIVHSPRIVILDEPTNGLDPNQISSVRSLIKEIAEERFVIFSSHILSEVQAICSHIIMIDDGAVVFNGDIQAFDEYTECKSMLLSMENPPDIGELTVISGVVEAAQLGKRRFRLTFDADPEIAEVIIGKSIEKGWRLREISFERNTLESTFAQLSIQRQKDEQK